MTLTFSGFSLPDSAVHRGQAPIVVLKVMSSKAKWSSNIIMLIGGTIYLCRLSILCQLASAENI